MRSGRKIKAALLALLVLALAVAGNPVVFAVEQKTTAKSEDNAVNYRVKKGDCLWSVARKFNINVSKLAGANDLEDSSYLIEGQLLNIPGAKTDGAGTVEDYVRAAEAAAREADLADFQFWPVTGAVSSVFGPRKGHMHRGLDIAVEQGKAIRALAGGTVVFAGERGDYGNAVIINHGNGVRSLYAHASAFEVSEGEYVEQGQMIAQVGSTGNSTGPHLHLEIQYRGIPMDPVNYLPCVAQN